jgi:cytochrome c peroxidase
MNHKRILLSVVACAALLLVATLAVAAQGGPLTANEELGKLIFFDEDLSINGNQSCATCHDPEWGWTGPDSAINAGGSVYEGSIPDVFGDRKPPSSAYATQSPVLHMDRRGTFVGGNFWDGRATGELLGNPAADQAQGPFLNPKEQALPDSACVVYFVCTATYDVPFTSVWGADACAIDWPADVEDVCAEEDGVVVLTDEDRAQSDMNYDSIALSIAAYEASPEVNAFNSKFDLSKRGQAKLTQQERQGWALFQGQAKCARCHTANGQQPLFTDFTFDNLGIPINPANPVYDYDPDYVDWGLGGFLATRSDYAPYAEDNMGMHKVPTMRNVDLRPSAGDVKAFGHNGYFKSLEGIVHFYNTRDVKDVCPGDYTEAQALAADCWPPPEVTENVNTAELGDLGLSPAQEAAIVAFLKTLSDGFGP